MSKPKLCFVTAVPMTVNAFLRTPIERLVADYEVIVISDFSAGEANVPPSVTCLSVPLVRDISIGKDLCGLRALVALFRRHRFDVVLSVTPKAGLLAMVASFLARVPLRLHMFTGQVWATRTGWKRQGLKAVDRLIARLATHVLADSPSQRAFLVAEGVLPAGKIQVLGSGSICGVDGERFRPNVDRRHQVRNRLGIPASATVYLFLGRLNRDKGILDLAAAYAALADPRAWLLIVGPDEAALRPEIGAHLGDAAKRTSFVDFTDRPEDFMAASDIFCLPSYREGFGMVIIEAAACGLPAIGSRIYGISDAIEEGGTGLLHRPGDVKDIAAQMRNLADDPERCSAMGRAARSRALDEFSGARLTQAWVSLYRELLG